MNKHPLYLDYAATTPMDPRVADKMHACLKDELLFGNPSSTHIYGLTAKTAVEEARFAIAQLINAKADEILITSGATESNNLALKGASALYQAKGKHIITMKTEHPSVLDCCQQLEKQGFSITYLAPETNGLLNIDQLRNAIRADTILVSIMHMNNETGIIQDIKSIADITSEKSILFHVDAAQSAGKILINLQSMPIDLLSLSAHKIYGPKGIGALYVRRMPRVRVAAQIHGGGQEQGMRSGTLPTHQIIGMGAAFAIAASEMQEDYQRLNHFRQQMLEHLQRLPNFQLNSDPQYAFPGILNFGFLGTSAAELIKSLPELAISAGSACSSKGNEPSYVLRAMGQTAEKAHCAIRLSFGRFTTQENIENLKSFFK